MLKKAKNPTIRNLVASYDWVFPKLGSQEYMPRPACEYLERGLGAIWTIDRDYVGKSYRGTLYPLRIYGLKCEKGERGGRGGGGGDEEGERRGEERREEKRREEERKYYLLSEFYNLSIFLGLNQLI